MAGPTVRANKRQKSNKRWTEWSGSKKIKCHHIKMRLNFLIALRASFAHMKRLFPRGRGSVRVPHSCFLPLHSLRSAPVSRSPGLATRGGIPALKRPVSRPPSADADHLEGIYPGAVFLLASSRCAARMLVSLEGPAVFGLISSFVGKEARLDRSDGGLFICSTYGWVFLGSIGS